MDPIVPRLEEETRRRRRMPLFRHRHVPVRMLVPNFFTLLALCAGLTSIRMGIEGRYELALGAIVFAALLDGIDGRVARLLKASSRFGAELDSLADFVNFGVAPAFLIFNWGLGEPQEPGLDLRDDLRARLRLAAGALQHRHGGGAAASGRRPTSSACRRRRRRSWCCCRSSSSTWASTPSAPRRIMLDLVLLYTLLIAFLMVSTIPTFSGKLLGERISREYVLPIFMLAVGFVALLVTYPFATLTGASIVYLALIPLSWRRLRPDRWRADAGAGAARRRVRRARRGRIVAIRSGDPPR